MIIPDLSTKVERFAFFREIMLSGKPSRFFTLLKDSGKIDIFPELKALIDVPQDPEWHPEGDVWTHTLMVLDKGAQYKKKLKTEREQLAFMFGCLCHDFGKPKTTVFEDGRWRSPDHHVLGIKPTRRFLERMTKDDDFIEEVIVYVIEHMNLSSIYKSRKHAKLSAFRRLNKRIEIDKLLLIVQADSFGRSLPEGRKRRSFPEKKWLLAKMEQLRIEDSKPRGYLTGKIIKSLGIKRGKLIGKLLDKAYIEQTAGNIRNEEEATEWARKEISFLKAGS